MSLVAPKPSKISGAGLSVAIVAARFNQDLVDALLADVEAHLRAAGVADRSVTVVRVPGSNELPVAAELAARKLKPDVVIALGVLIRGGTLHFELIAHSATDGLQRVALDLGLPVINGVLAADTRAQAAARCHGKIRRGAEFAQAALEMAALKRRFHQ